MNKANYTRRDLLKTIGVSAAALTMPAQAAKNIIKEKTPDPFYSERCL